MSGSPLGRYASPADDGPMHRVRLLNLPVRLLVDGQERHDALVRELALLALSGSHPHARQARFAELTEALGARYAAVQERPDPLVDDAARRDATTVDLEYDVPASVLEDAQRLEDLLAEADLLCRDEQLLTLPRTPLQLRFSAWYVGELRRQVAGEPPRPWDGPLDV